MVARLSPALFVPIFLLLPNPLLPGHAGETAKIHWSFRKPVRPAIPQFRDSSQKAWIRNTIDAFILDRLQREGLWPAPEADRRTLIRRLYFDLTGLPPTPEQIAAFVASRDPLA